MPTFNHLHTTGILMPISSPPLPCLPHASQPVTYQSHWNGHQAKVHTSLSHTHTHHCPQHWWPAAAWPRVADGTLKGDTSARSLRLQYTGTSITVLIYYLLVVWYATSMITHCMC